MKKAFTYAVIVGSVGYTLLIFYMLFRGFGRSSVSAAAWNIVPFDTIGFDLRNAMRGDGHARRNLLGNIVLMAPYGFALPFLFDGLRKPLRFIAVMAAAIVAIELTQLVTLTGSFDIDDFMLNFISAVCAFFVCRYTQINKLFYLRSY